MTTTAAGQPQRSVTGPPPRLLTIGAVCRRLKADFPEISISKIRYLEDQGLLQPKRTQGGYRLFGEADVERLRRILELQRDEFLPLRVIRQELDAGAHAERRRRRPAGLAEPEDEVGAAELAGRSGAPPELVRELEEFGLLVPRVEAGERLYVETDVEVAAACARLAAFGISPRHLRAFRTGGDRIAGLLEAAVAPALRARSPERRQAGVEDLQTLGELAQELSQLLLWRELRSRAIV
jgi:DNA-binding transcriptional MerR regulator